MTQIFVGNLPYTACENDLRSKFEPYGYVSSVRIPLDSSSNQPRGFAFVSMPSMEDAEEAMKRIAGSSLGGRRLTVNESEGRSEGSSSGSRTSGSCSKTMDIFKRLQDE